MQTFKKLVPFEVTLGCVHSVCNCKMNLRNNVYSQFLFEKANQDILFSSEVSTRQFIIKEEKPKKE